MFVKMCFYFVRSERKALGRRKWIFSSQHIAWLKDEGTVGIFLGFDPTDIRSRVKFKDIAGIFAKIRHIAFILVLLYRGVVHSLSEYDGGLTSVHT